MNKAHKFEWKEEEFVGFSSDPIQNGGRVRRSLFQNTPQNY
jgi:hypothetical protein